MGHYASKIDPAGAEARARYFERLRALKEKMKDVPLSLFTVAELGAVMRLMGLEYGITGTKRLSEEDFELLERKTPK